MQPSTNKAPSKVRLNADLSPDVAMALKQLATMQNVSLTEALSRAISTESVLAQAGVITQTVYAYTFVSSLPKKTTVDSISYLFRKLKDEYLYNPAGIVNQGGFFVASTERAVADMLYFNRKYHFDVLESIDFKKVKFIQKEVGYLC